MQRKATESMSALVLLDRLLRNHAQCDALAAALDKL
jgi:hypothetical protein